MSLRGLGGLSMWVTKDRDDGAGVALQAAVLLAGGAVMAGPAAT